MALLDVAHKVKVSRTSADKLADPYGSSFHRGYWMPDDDVESGIRVSTKPHQLCSAIAEF
jgi:hypothetical protein